MTVFPDHFCPARRVKGLAPETLWAISYFFPTQNKCHQVPTTSTTHVNQY